MSGYVVTYTQANGNVKTIDIDNKSTALDMACSLAAYTRNTVRVANVATGKVCWKVGSILH